MYGQAALVRLRHTLHRLDWSLIKGSLLLSAGSAAARALAMLFWLILARALTPGDYGATQYIITLGMIVAVATHPLGQHVLARYSGMYQDDPARLQIKLSNIWALLLVLSAATVAVGVPAMLALGKYDHGALVVFVGITLYYAYWGLASGFGAPARLTIATLASNMVQLVLVALVIYGLGAQSPTLAAAIYGASYLLPLLVLQRARGLPVRMRPAEVQRGELGEIVGFTWPIWVSHVSYTLSSALPILLLEFFSGNAAVGVFSLGITLTALFGIVNVSIATLLMPRIARAPHEERARLLGNGLALYLLANVPLFAGYVLLVEWFVGSFFGPAYSGSMLTYTALALGTLPAGIKGLLAAVLMGQGDVRIEAAGRAVGLAVVGVVGLALVPRHAELGAALALNAGTVAALAVFAAMAWRRRQR